MNRGMNIQSKSRPLPGVSLVDLIGKYPWPILTVSFGPLIKLSYMIRIFGKRRHLCRLARGGANIGGRVVVFEKLARSLRASQRLPTIPKL